MKAKKSDLLALRTAERQLKKAQAKQDRLDKKRKKVGKAFDMAIEERNKAKLNVINIERRCAGLKPRASLH